MSFEPLPVWSNPNPALQSRQRAQRVPVQKYRSKVIAGAVAATLCGLAAKPLLGHPGASTNHAQARNRRGPPWLGVVFSQSQSALAVDAVVVDSPAERAGLRAGDAVVSLNGQTFAQSRDAVSAIQRLSAGTALPIVVSRAGQRISLSATLATAPELGDLPQNPAPPLRAVVAANGGSADLLALRGRVVVVDFFASWCGPCRLTMPWLNQLQNRLANQGLSVIGITDETAREAQQIALSLHVQYTLATDATGPMRWGVRSLPTLVVIDRAGIVREYYNGSDSQQNRALESLVRRLLAEPAPAAPTAPATAVPATPPTTTTATNPARAAPAPTNVPRTP